MDQLAQIERLCFSLYNATNPAERAQAENALAFLSASADYIPQCQLILEHSNEPYAQLLASASLIKQVGDNWSTLNASQRTELRNYMLNYLAARGPKLATFVSISIIQLICKLTKIGWFDDEVYRGITDDIAKFLQASVEHCIIGLQMLNQLVSEMNQPGNKPLAQHRKISINFRDVSLLSIFQVSIATLKQLPSRSVYVTGATQEDRVKELALQLAQQCLSYDFIGTSIDESTEDLGTVQVQIPNTWRPIIEDSDTMQLFFDVYTHARPPSSHQALECLVCMASVRRSLFSEDRERKKYLAHLLQCSADIARNQIGLREQENHHVFCRLLARIKANNQLAELVSTDGFREWMDLSAAFTVQTFQSWQWAANSMHYLLNLWSRLVQSMPFLRGETPGLLDSYVPEVIKAYITSRLEVAQSLELDDASEDALDDDEHMVEQLEALPTLCRFQYDKSAQYIISIFEPIATEYRSLLSVSMPDASTLNRLHIREGEVTWMVYIIGSIVGGRMCASCPEAHEVLDGELASCVFRVMQWANAALQQTNRQDKSAERLEMGLLYFLQSFRKVYIGEQAMSSTKVYTRIAERVGFNDHLSVLNLMVTKIGTNLKYWTASQGIADRTLSLFHELASGYSSRKLLLKLDSVSYIMANHTAENFPFLEVPANTRHRTTFYQTLARFLFEDESQLNQRFRTFMLPFDNVFAALSSLRTNPQTMRQDVVQSKIIGVMRDLRGIVSATTNRRTYTLFFDWIYPAHMQLLVLAAEVNYDRPAVTTPLLKLMAELVYNKAQRLVFDCSSPNGILLFRETSKILVAYGSRILNHPVSKDPYAEKYKGIWISLAALQRALSGNYVNFGVFVLYNDLAFSNALDIALKLALSIPLQDLMSFPKLTKAYFALMEILCHNHTADVLSLDTPVFYQIISSILEGLKSIDIAVSSQCAAATDHLAAYYYTNIGADTPPMRAIAAHLHAHPDAFARLLAVLLNSALFEDAANQWSISRPLLTLILFNEKFFNEYKMQVVASQPPERQQRLLACFDKLMQDIQPNLDSKNRDRFAQNLNVFRHDFRTRVMPSSDSDSSPRSSGSSSSSLVATSSSPATTSSAPSTSSHASDDSCMGTPGPSAATISANQWGWYTP